MMKLPVITDIYSETLPEGITGMALARRFAGEQPMVFLKSGGNGKEARFDILAVNPFLTLSAKNGRSAISIMGRKEGISGNALDLISEIQTFFHMPHGDAPAFCGLFGYLAYELLHQIESVPRLTVDDLDLPDLWLMIPRRVFVFDAKTGTNRAITVKVAEDPEPVPDIRDILGSQIPESCGFSVSGPLMSGFSRHSYEAAVRDIVSRIGAGDVYQVNLSQRFSTGFQGSALDLFSALFQENPAAFYAYIQAKDHQIVSTSPERFLLRDDDVVETRPIKGTRPRGRTGEEDKARICDLVTSEKDEAELSMIVDLMRNDLGRICAPGSISVSGHKTLESYANVHHLVSTVSGRLKPETSASDLIRAVFPPGSITGCPKIRSMEIISELEPVVRHVYTGAIGYLGFDDRMDLSVAIRTAIIRNEKLYLSAGGGVVYDSRPESEYEETLHKADTFMKMLRPEKHFPEETVVYHNGKFVPESHATVPAFSLSVMYGMGCFETIRSTGMDILFLNEHICRMQQSWKIMTGREIPAVCWEDILRHLLMKNGLSGKTGAVKIMLMDTKSMTGSDIVMIRAVSYTHRLKLKKKDALDIVTYSLPRQTPWSRHKTLNYLFYYQAGKDAECQGADEALILNPDGSVSETNTANIAMVRGREVRFADPVHALPGVMAGILAAHLSENGWTVSRGKVMPEDLISSDGVFLTNSLMGAVAVRSLDNRSLKDIRWLCEIMNQQAGISP